MNIYDLFFSFISNEHLPIHVHVTFAEYESNIEMEFENGKVKNLRAINVKSRLPLPSKGLKEALKFVKKYQGDIAEKWTLFFVRNKKVQCEVITKKFK